MTRAERKERMAKLRTIMDETIVNDLEAYASAGNKKCIGVGLSNAIQGGVNVLIIKHNEIAPHLPYQQYKDLVFDRATVIAERLNIIFEHYEKIRM